MIRYARKSKSNAPYRKNLLQVIPLPTESRRETGKEKGVKGKTQLEKLWHEKAQEVLAPLKYTIVYKCISM